MPVKDSRTSAGNPAFRPLETAGPPRHEADHNTPAVPNVRRLWGKLREGVSGFFSSHSDDKFNDDNVAEFIPEKPEQVVSIDGRVKAPGHYPLEPMMRVSDLKLRKS